MSENIIVTLPKSRGGVAHLQEKIEALEDFDIVVFWEFSRMPKKLYYDSKIYIVCEGFLRGYFTIFDIERTYVILKEWFEIPHVEYKGFQGFRYFKYFKENEEN